MSKIENSTEASENWGISLDSRSSCINVNMVYTRFVS